MHDVAQERLTLASSAQIAPAERAALITYLSQFVTERRRQRIEAVLQMRTRFLAVVLENLSKAHNASAIIRSCDSFGVQDLHVVDTQQQFEFKRTATSGAHQWVTHYFYDAADHQANLNDCFGRLRAGGYRIVATTLRGGAQPLHQLDLEQPLALVLGTELYGVTDEAHDMADAWVQVPTVGFGDSLNVSVAAAICLYDLSDRLRRSAINWQLPDDERELLRLQWLANSVDQPDKLIAHFFDNRDGS